MIIRLSRWTLLASLAGLMSLIWLSAGCTSGSTPLPPAGQQTTAPAPVAKAGPEAGWDKLVAEAKKEGKVSVSADRSTEREALVEAFKNKFGIDLEFTVGRSVELLPKIAAERQAGLYLRDVYIAGISSMIQFKDNGLLEPSLDSQLVLPEVTDPKLWTGGGINFIGKDRYAMSFYSRAVPTLVVNSELVKPEEIKSYKDLLDPKWKGKIVMQDPTVSGSGNMTMTVVAWELNGKEYFNELAKQEPLLTRDSRLQVEWVARGKYPVMLAPYTDMLAEFQKAGAPLRVVWPSEGIYLSAGYGCLGMMKKPPHPAGAKLFANWLLTKEGQTVMAKAGGTRSARLDVPEDWLDPGERVQPGRKYIIVDTEENGLLRIKTQEMAKEIFASLLK